MRLRDLDAWFCADANPTERSYRRQEGIAGAQGILFQCPKCAVGCEPGEEDGRRFFRGAHYILCWFSNTGGGVFAPAADVFTPSPRWRLESGTSLDDITLSPSIQIVGGCAWHGFVRNGSAVE